MARNPARIHRSALVGRPLAERVPTVAAALGAMVAGADATTVPVLPHRDALRLARVAAEAPSRLADPEVGPPERRVWQSFRVVTHLPPAIRGVARELEAVVNAATARLAPRPGPPLTFTDMTLQRYPVGGYGITPHRDHRRFRYLTLVLVLAGEGRFLVCEDRAGRGAREVPAGAGDLLLMRAPGFAGRRRRPFHAVVDVTRPRITLGLRHGSVG